MNTELRPYIYNPPRNPYISILYEDNCLLALSKPSGLLTVPGKPAEHADCLESRVQSIYPTAKVVHRLDVDTSGVIVVSLDKPTLAALSMQFEKRQTKKTYIARVFGNLTPDKGRVDQPLICDWPNRPKQKIDPVNGKQAITDWEVIEREEQATRVRLYPITGRSHQLRVHMSSLGHSILGDNLYADDKAFTAADRLQLHAEYLTIKHPQNNNTIEFHSPCEF